MPPLVRRIRQLLLSLAAICIVQRCSVVVVAQDSSSSSSVIWDKYALSPRKCIYFNNQDVIIYSMFDNGNTVCSGQAAGLYYTNVPTFVNAYLQQQQQDAQLSGNSYQEPSVASYLSCTLYEHNGQNVRTSPNGPDWNCTETMMGHCSSYLYPPSRDYLSR
jgi:hypothetical protein